MATFPIPSLTLAAGTTSRTVSIPSGARTAKLSLGVSGWARTTTCTLLQEIDYGDGVWEHAGGFAIADQTGNPDWTAPTELQLSVSVRKVTGANAQYRVSVTLNVPIACSGGTVEVN